MQLLKNISFLSALLCFIGGAGIGFLYFESLYRTVSVLPKIKRKALFLFFSFFVRISILLSVLYLVAKENVLRAIAFLMGFMLVRYLYVSKKSKPVSEKGGKK